MAIADLLATARAHHAVYRQQARTATHPGNVEAATAAIQAAYDARMQAGVEDAAQTDQAWAEDAAINRGVTNTALLTFYRSYLHL